MLKKILKIVGIAVIVLVLAAIAIPYFFKDKIVAKVKSALNEQLTAKVDFKDVDISLLRHFPRLAVGLEDLQITNTGDFAGDTLLSVKQIDVALNLMSVIKGEKMDIYNITLSQPRIHAIVNKDGAVNWNITKPDTTAAAADTAKSNFALSLRQYKIEDAWISYDDRQGNMELLVTGLTHEGKGDFTQDQFLLQTSTVADGITFRYGLIPYLSQVKTKLDADIQVDNNSNTYTFKDGKATLNNLELALQGFKDGYAMRRYIAGAMAMGFGAMLAGGCAVGAGVSGGAIFSLTTWIALAAMWAGAALTDRVLDREPAAP